MKLGPRAKLLALVALFVLPILASVLAYNFLDVKPTANYGELIVPPAPIPAQRFTRPDGTPFTFGELAGKWILVTADSPACEAACREKLVAMRQARQAVGRNAPRIERVLVVEGARPPAGDVLEPFPGTLVAVTGGVPAAQPVASDRAHIYLVDPNGNVMMRWPAAPDGRRMVKDLERLLKASQIG